MKTSIANSIYQIHVTAVLRYSPYSPVYLVLSIAEIIATAIVSNILTTTLPLLQYCKKGYSKKSTCPTLFCNGSHAFPSFFSFSGRRKDALTRFYSATKQFINVLGVNKIVFEWNGTIFVYTKMDVSRNLQ